MRTLLLLSIVVFTACQPRTRRIVHGPSTPKVPQCTVSLPALRVTDVTCQGDFSSADLWRASLEAAAETGPEHGSFSFDAIDTNEQKGWRALRAKFASANEAQGQFTIDAVLPAARLDAARTRAMVKACQRAVIIAETDAATRATCTQFLTAQQQLAQQERHHAEELGVQKQALAVQQQQAEAQQRQADALMLQALQRSSSTVIVVGGNACRSSLDCGSGQFCKLWRGNFTCLGHGGRGSPCMSGLDCGGGLFCRGDLCN
jgi:hypothetical protein